MTKTTINVDQSEEETFTQEISDEALEAAAATQPRVDQKTTYSIISPFCA